VSAAARDSGKSASSIEDMSGFPNASPRAAATLAELHTRYLCMELLLKGARLADDDAKAPRLFPLMIAAREYTLQKAGRTVSVKDVEDDEEWIVGLERRESYRQEFPSGALVISSPQANLHEGLAKVAPQTRGVPQVRI
jgi:hypothetical protein